MVLDGQTRSEAETVGSMLGSSRLTTDSKRQCLLLQDLAPSGRSFPFLSFSLSFSVLLSFSLLYFSLRWLLLLLLHHSKPQTGDGIIVGASKISQIEQSVEYAKKKKGLAR